MTIYKPKVRNSFSDRNGINKINIEVQKNSLDGRTRNRIINYFDKIIEHYDNYCELDSLYNYIFKSVFLLTKDDIPIHHYECRDIIVKGLKSEWSYDEVFSFLEELCAYVNKRFSFQLEPYTSINNIFEQECVGYRFVDGLIIDLIDDCEIKEIETAINNKYDACKKSISKAMRLLYDRKKPDYSNSVKESISAVEAMCNIINGKKDTLNNALKQLEKKGYKIHEALKNGFISIYGYTSDKGGIRHNNGIDENTTFEEAKFMLVACSSFINYLICVYEKTN